MLRSRIGWLKAGDRNTDYFHNYASVRRAKNRINKLRDESGVWRDNIPDLNPFISGYFAGLFSIEVDEPDPEVINKVIPKVDDHMNGILMQEYTAEEVKKALFSIGDMKAPGPDSLHAVFFKK